MKRLFTISVLTMVAVLFTSVVSAQDAGPKSYVIGPIEFDKAIKINDPNIVIVDVRTPDEYNEGHIPGSINIDYRSDDFSNLISELDKSKTYYIYCKAGTRSGRSRVIMNDLGIKNVFDMEGGFTAWKEKKLPIQ